MEIVTISGNLRQAIGKNSGKLDRRAGRVPGVLYGGGEIYHFTTTPSELKSLVYSPDFKMVALDLDGTVHNCILKDIQFHPVTDEIVHIDMLRTVENHAIKVSVPVKFTGVSIGVKNGGKFIQNMRNIKIKAIPTDLVDHLVLDITKLRMGQVLRVKDLIVGKGIEVLEAPLSPVVAVEVPRALKSDKDALAAAEAEDEEEVTEGAEA